MKNDESRIGIDNMIVTFTDENGEEQKVNLFVKPRRRIWLIGLLTVFIFGTSMLFNMVSDWLIANWGNNWENAVYGIWLMIAVLSWDLIIREWKHGR